MQYIRNNFSYIFIVSVAYRLYSTDIYAYIRFYLFHSNVCNVLPFKLHVIRVYIQPYVEINT